MSNKDEPALLRQPLTRELTVRACGRLQDLYPHLKNIQLILDTDEAHRQQLVESDRVKQGLDNDVRVLFVRIEELRKQLAEAHSEIARLQERS